MQALLLLAKMATVRARITFSTYSIHMMSPNKKGLFSAIYLSKVFFKGTPLKRLP